MRYGKNFWMLSFSMFFFMTSFNLIIPELNTFITRLGGEEFKGLIVAIFTISAALSRPFSGKLADHIGRKKVMYFGIAICITASLFYPLSSTVLLFLILRFFHGFSTGFLPTGATALATDILPPDRRGQGMGIWGVFTSLGIGVGQSLGSMIERSWGMDNLFFISAGTAGISGILIAYIKETLPHPKSFSMKYLAIKGEDVVDRSVLPSSIVMFLTAICSGIIFVITPDMTEFIGIPNKGAFFTYYVSSTILIRIFTANLSDIIGRRWMLVIGFSVLMLSMYLVAISNTEFMFALGAIVFGIATGISSPTIFAWTADLSHPMRRGVGAGTMFIALETGIMVGASSCIFTYDNTENSIFYACLVGMISTIVAIIYLVWHLINRTSAT